MKRTPIFPGFDPAELTHPGTGRTCKTCKHRQTWECGNRNIQYCAVTPSGRTENGLLKIKCKMLACVLYEERGI